MSETIVEIIKGMLAPGIMISACGLLLLGMNNKYSLVINRVRTLNVEFRLLNKENKERRDCILMQLPLLVDRMKMVRNAVWLYTIGIAMFIFSIFSIGLYLLNGNAFVLTIISISVFVFGLISVLIGVLYAAGEVRLAYKIMSIEIKNIHYIDD